MPNLHKNFIEYDLELQGKSKNAMERARIQARIRNIASEAIRSRLPKQEPEVGIDETISSIDMMLEGKFQGNTSLLLDEVRPEGCLKMDTLILDEGNTTTLDLGIHFRNLKTVSSKEVFDQLFDAARGLGKGMPEKKRHGILLRYSPRTVVRFFPYLPHKDGQHQLFATEQDGFLARGPEELCDWFENKVHFHGPQLPRIARYLQGWLSHLGRLRKLEMPDSVCSCIWAAKAFQADKRDDVAFLKTIRRLDTIDFMGTHLQCICPTFPQHNLTQYLESNSGVTIRHALRELQDDAQMAISDRLPFGNAARIWSKHFGNRFPENNF